MVTRFVWTVVVLFAVLLSGFFIYKHNIAWDENPVVTSVQQISIEQIEFPSITVCPLDQTRYM